jgi:hypothetical protein
MLAVVKDSVEKEVSQEIPHWEVADIFREYGDA